MVGSVSMFGKLHIANRDLASELPITGRSIGQLHRSSLRDIEALLRERG
jgi:hypothetical protein